MSSKSGVLLVFLLEWKRVSPHAWRDIYALLTQSSLFLKCLVNLVRLSSTDSVSIVPKKRNLFHSSASRYNSIRSVVSLCLSHNLHFWFPEPGPRILDVYWILHDLSQRQDYTLILHASKVLGWIHIVTVRAFTLRLLFITLESLF